LPAARLSPSSNAVNVCKSSTNFTRQQPARRFSPHSRLPRLHPPPVVRLITTCSQPDSCFCFYRSACASAVATVRPQNTSCLPPRPVILGNPSLLREDLPLPAPGYREYTPPQINSPPCRFRPPHIKVIRRSCNARVVSSAFLVLFARRSPNPRPGKAKQNSTIPRHAASALAHVKRSSSPTRLT